MKFSIDNKIYLMTLVFIAAIVLGGSNANADFTFSRAVNSGPPLCSSYDDSSPFISADGLSLFFATNRSGGSGDFDLWISTRTSTSKSWGEPVNLGQTINTSSLEWHPSITADGLELYFDSNRPGGQGSWDLWVAKRDSTQGPWGTPVNLGPVINSSIFEESSSISGDGLTLLWNSKRPGGYGDSDIWMTTRGTRDEPWGEPVNIGPAINTELLESNAIISADDLAIFFTAWPWPDGYGDFDIWFSRRASKNADWGTPVNLGQTINTSSLEWHPSITADGLELYFDSNRPGGQGSWDLWVAKRDSTQGPWGTPVNLGPVINSSIFEESSSISGDGLTLLWNSKRPGGYGDSDIWMTTRGTRDEPWGEPVNIGPAINTELLESNAIISADDLAIFFTAWPWPDGYGDFDIWFSRRASKDADWGTPVNLGLNVNTAFSEYCPNISSDGTTLYFSDWPTQRPGGNGAEDIWQALITPVVDFNGDGNIDTDDLLILIDNWNTSQTLCDIGPMPWGDGVVDMEDLTVFIRYWEQENFPDVNVDEDDDGGEVVLKQGQVLVVTLESNPSTGYSWAVLENQNPILEQVGESEYKPSEQGDPPMVGAGGWEIFRFKAVNSGQTTLKLVYRRPWETEANSANTFTIDVVVN